MIGLLGLNTRAPYHLLFYSFVFGGSAFYSFVASPIAFKVLEREQFGILQNKVFPGYFLGQTVSPLILALTTPVYLCPFTISVFVVSSVAGALNYFWLLPVCTKIKDKRKELVAAGIHEIDGQPTEEFERLTKQFGKYHGISLLANMASIISLGIYGMFLSKRLLK